MRNDNQTSVIANAYLNMLKDRFAPKDEVVVEETSKEVVQNEIIEEDFEIVEFDQEQWDALSEEEQAQYEDIPELEEAMTPAMAKAVRAHSSTGKVAPGYVSHHDLASDKSGDMGTPRKTQSQSAKIVRKAKKIIKRDGGQAAYDRVKKKADDGFARRNYS